jgi:hypothetical protein
MRAKYSCALTVIVLMVASAASALAAGPAPVTFGTSWDGPGHDLQTIVDGYLGGPPHQLDVHSAYEGGSAGDPDPWFWFGDHLNALLVTEVAGNADFNELGWYLETGAPPLMGDPGHGVVFTGAQGANATTLVLFPTNTTRFGFYLDTHHTIPTPLGAREQVFYTNRRFNDPGPNGTGALRAPWDGDVQALVFDVSQWKGPNTWLVCFEDLDAGAPITPCCSGTDADYNDFVFQVTALGATPDTRLSFGALKARYR